MYSPVNKVRVFIYTAAVLFCTQVELFGAPHNGDLYTVKQPNGSYVQVSVWGDEFYQRAESLDGYTVVRDPNTRWICYAKLNQDASELLSTGIIYDGTAIDETAGLKTKTTVLGLPKHLEIKTEVVLQKVTQARLKFMGPQPAVTAEAEAALRSESLTGDVNGLTLLIDFPDEPATISRQEIENYVNQIGYTGYGNNGSVRDYFSDVSGGLLNYTNYVTEYYTGLGRYLQVRRYPIVSISSIKEAALYDFDGADTLVVNEGYRIIAAGAEGILHRVYTNWLNTPDGIQVIYKGGYCSAGQAPGEGEYLLPDDLREAAIEQSSFIFKRKDDLGLSAVGFQGGSISKFSAMDLLPMVKKVLDNYRRPSL